MNLHGAISKLFGVGSVEVGQVWVSEWDNPFDPKEHTFRILDVQQGYVKYLFDEKVESSQLISMFKLRKKLKA